MCTDYLEKSLRLSRFLPESALGLVGEFPLFFPVVGNSSTDAGGIGRQWDRSCGHERRQPEIGRCAGASVRGETAARAEVPPIAGHSRQFPELVGRPRSAWRRGCQVAFCLDRSRPITKTQHLKVSRTFEILPPSQAISLQVTQFCGGLWVDRGVEKMPAGSAKRRQAIGLGSSGMRNRLTTKFVERVSTPGTFPDGGGLFLQVQTRTDGRAAKSWVVRYRSNTGRIREMGLGTLLLVPLADARMRALEARRKAYAGIDPIDERRGARATIRSSSAKQITFQECAEIYISAHSGSWKNAKHREQWTSTLEKYAYPIFGNAPVTDIDQEAVFRVLDPIWSIKTETANRLRGRIEAILDWAKVRGYRTGENPARWKGHMAKAFPARTKIQPIEHHPALPYKELPEFMAKLLAIESIGAKAFAI